MMLWIRDCYAMCLLRTLLISGLPIYHDILPSAFRTIEMLLSSHIWHSHVVDAKRLSCSDNCQVWTLLETLHRNGIGTRHGSKLTNGNRNSMGMRYDSTLQWRHNERDGVSNHQPHDCLLNRLIKAQIKEDIQAPPYWPLWGKFMGDWWNPRTKGQ